MFSMDRRRPRRHRRSCKAIAVRSRELKLPAGAPAVYIAETPTGKKAEPRFNSIQTNAKFVAEEIDV